MQKFKQLCNRKWFQGMVLAVILFIITLVLASIDTNKTREIVIVGDNKILEAIDSLKDGFRNITTIPDIPHPFIYTQQYWMKHTTHQYVKDYTNLDNGGTRVTIRHQKFNLFNVKVILPSNQELFLSEYLYDQEYVVAYSNDDGSDYYIPHKYRITYDFNDEDVCFINYANPKSDEAELMQVGPKYISDEESCYETYYCDNLGCDYE